jgi:hypothetical protein
LKRKKGTLASRRLNKELNLSNIEKASKQAKRKRKQGMGKKRQPK